MTIIAPNDFINNNKTIGDNDTIFTKYTTTTSNKKISVRTTTHSMIILLSGEKKVSQDTKSIYANGGDIIFLSQNNYYMGEFITKESTYEAILVYFTDKFVKDFIYKYKLRFDDIGQVDIVKLRYQDDINYLLNIKLLEQYIKKAQHNLLKIKLEELFLLSLENKEFSLYLNGIINSSSNRIQNIIEQNLDCIDSVSDICLFTKLSTTQLRSYFIKKHNQNPKQWLNQKRLSKAMTLVKQTQKSISQISQDCGYATVSWFIHSFKKQYGKTPKEIRQKK